MKAFYIRKKSRKPQVEFTLFHLENQKSSSLFLTPWSHYKLESGSLVGVVCKTLPIGSIIYKEYVLLQSFPILDSQAKRAGRQLT